MVFLSDGSTVYNACSVTFNPAVACSSEDPAREVPALPGVARLTCDLVYTSNFDRVAARMLAPHHN